MLRRPNVRARCYRLNVQIAHRANYRFGWVVQGRYFRQCRWCRRPVTQWHREYPRLCAGCGQYIRDLEYDHLIARGFYSIWEGHKIPKRILKLT